VIVLFKYIYIIILAFLKNISKALFASFKGRDLEGAKNREIYIFFECVLIKNDQ
jgi:hypothetical protein